ncbi:MAG: NTP transferase domain-containing protein [Candidatus Beckwithbacteria bacterium]|nr:NTP transferase domain-containing protein [Candidatus Beckwithbacteria bacterium]
MSNLTALILAAGAGKRIKPIVTGKPFLPFCGQTLLSWIINDLKSIGIKQFIVVVNPQDKEKVKKHPLAIQEKPTGMAGAVLAARRLLAGPTIIVNGDDLIDPKIWQAFKAAIIKTPDQICLTGIKSDLTGGYFDLQGENLQVVEKPTEAERPSNWLKLVLDYFPNIQDFITVLDKVQSDKDGLYEKALNQLLEIKPAQLVKADGYFQPLKFPWQILDMTQIFLINRLKPGIDKTASIHPTAVIEGPVQIEAGAKIMPYAVIKGPAFLGKNVLIGDHVLVRQSLIESNSIVGFKSEICRSYVGPNNNFHSNYVGDSVIEADSNLGSGATLANLRFDKKEIIPGRIKFGCVMARASQLGVNTSVMPGITLGAKAIANSGLVIKENLAANEFKKN